MTNGAAALLAVHLLATAAMGGLIWFVQLVHYPLFAAVGPSHFVAYEASHTRRTSWVVGPLMAVEGLAAIALLLTPVDGVGRAAPLVGLALLGVIHLSTVLIQVPCHRQLASGYDSRVARRLVGSNWIRTVGWSARSVLAAGMLVMAP